MKRLLSFFMFALALYTAHAQVGITPSSAVIHCPGQAVTLNATPACNDNTLSMPDDVYSSVLPLGFYFRFYGNTYNQFLISSNGYLSFDLGNAGLLSPYIIASGIPGNSALANSIAGVYADIFMVVSGSVSWGVRGTAPNRKLVVTYCNCPLYNCKSQLVDFQIMLYETTNIIEVHITRRDNCSSGTGGKGIEGVENSSMTAGTAVPGRNFPSGLWTVTTPEAYRFTPNAGYTGYSVAPIPYEPEPGCNFTWYDGSGTIVGYGPTITVTPSATTTYHVVRSGCNGGSSTAYATVTLIPQPTTAGVVTCPGNFCAANPLSYVCNVTGNSATGTWSLAGGGGDVTIDPTFGWLAVNTTMTVPRTVTASYTVSNACGTDVASCTFTVYPNPQYTVTNSPGITVCSGDPFTLAVSPALPGYTYHWSTGATTSSITQTMTTLSGYSYVFTVSVTNSYGCTTNASGYQNVDPGVEAGVVHCPGNFCAANEISYLCNVTGNSVPGIWSLTGGFGDVTIDPVDGGLYVNSDLAEPRYITVYYIVSNACDADTATCSFTVYPNPKYTVTGPDSGCFGEPFTFGIGFTPPYTAPGHTYHWSTGATTPAITDVKGSYLSYEYSVAVTNSWGCTTKATKDITIFPLPAPIIENVPVGGITLCVGDVRPSVFGFVPGGGTFTSAWSASPAGIVSFSSPSSFTTSITGVSPGIVTLTYTATNTSTHCSGFATYVLTVNPNPAPITGPTTACIGNTITLFETVPGGVWYSANTLLATVANVGGNGVVTGVAPGTVTIIYAIGSCNVRYLVTVVPSPTPVIAKCVTDICEGNSQVVPGDPLYNSSSYSTTWTCSPPSGGVITLSAPSATGVTITGTTAGTATLTYTVTDIGGCYGYSVCTITVHPAPPPLTGLSRVCQGSVVTLMPPPYAGGTWISSDPAIAKVDGFGNVTGISGGTVTIDYILPAPMSDCYSSMDVTVIPRASACVQWAYDAACSCNAFVFTGSPMAHVNFDVYDCSGTLILSGSVPLDPSGNGVVYASGLPSNACRLCIKDIEYMGCRWPCSCPKCCAVKGLPKPGVSVKGTMHEELEIVPNPNNGQFSVHSALPAAGKVHIEVLDMLGRTLYTEHVVVKDNYLDHTITISDNVANGVYFIKVSNDDINEIRRFTLKR